MRPSYVQSVAPTEPVVSVDDVILASRWDADEDRPRIERLIQSATAYIQKRQWSQLVTATWVARMPSFPCDEIELHPNPVQSVSVSYTDTSGATQALVQNTDFTLDTYSQPAVIRPAYGRSWPTSRGYANDVVVTVVAGYGAAAAVPDTIKDAILAIVDGWLQGCPESQLSMAAEALIGVDSFAGFV